MARIWQDGFEFNKSSNATMVTYDTVTSGVVGTTNVRTGTYAAQITSLVSSTAQGWNKKFQSAISSVTYFRAYLYVVTLPSSTNTIMAQTGSSTLAASMRGCIGLTSSGTLILSNNGTQIGSASSAVNDGNWHMLEIKMDTTPASGSRVIEGRLDGTVFATSSAQTVGTAGDIFVGGNGFNESQTTGEWWFDDLAVNDNTGSYQTSYPGSGKILQLYPNATGDANGFLVQVGGTVGSANNYTRVNEIPPDDATSYNASAVLNAQDLFMVQNSGIGVSDTVNVVMVGSRIANITGADPTAAIAVQIEKTSGGTIASSANIIPDSTSWNTNGSTSPRQYPLITYLDPDGVNPWTMSTLDSMQIGYQLKATNLDAIGVTNIWASVDYTPAITVTQQVGELTLLGIG